MEQVQEPPLYHFSHQHPMVRTTSSISDVCSGCKISILPANGYYACKTCPFYLHRVCHSMPRKTRHPSHPDHLLTLHVIPSARGGTVECEACGHPVNGFYYNCAECSICYHVLCSALPLSVSITSHLHTLKLEFSPPFDLQCDICQKLAVYNGWLYRCQICEFDAHLACGISNQITQSFRHPTAPVADSSTTKIKNSSASIMETKQREYYVNEGTELMQLVSLCATRNIRENEVVGWHQRLLGPKKKLTTGNGPKPDIASTSPGPKARETDKSSLISSDMSMEPTPSYQFSDGCFSIDLAGSYSSFDHASQERKESKVSDDSGPGKVEETTNERKNVLDRITKNFEPMKQEIIYVKKESFDSRLSTEAFLSRNRTHSEEQGSRKKMSKESKTMSAVGNQSNKPDKGWNIFNCCLPQKNERSITVFNDGRS
ncbi:hypothetical protein V6N13_148796 [Hibiscus sabdariffa]|uniref:DC1 domain-containing protein n=1 Tax=Hibiscus sabdariffa TaxID=183260 RepID=A0ABR2EJ99_9ROSI